ncbi:putative tyrosinase [Seiridium cardinale]
MSSSSDMDELRAAQKAGVVIGLAKFGDKQLHLDIDEMIVQQPDTLNLFCLAIDEFMASASSDWMSYYQIAGIHGLPTEYWDGVTAIDKMANLTKDRNAQGYCPHGDPKFPTWHRPYIAMMEQTVFLKMNDIAEEFLPATRNTY